MSDKNLYREFCRSEEGIPVFSLDWWLDAVCGADKWDACLVKRGKEILASMPYYVQRRKGLSFVTMPTLTQTLGPYIRYPTGQKYGDRLAYEKEIMNELIDQLPELDYFSQNWHYSVTNWLPFYWRDFKQTTRYTYVIEDLRELDEVWKRFSHAKKKNIAKSEKIVTVKYDLSANAFYANHELTLAKQGARISYPFGLFDDIYRAGYQNGAAKTIYAEDDEGNIHAALFVIWNQNSAYDLISTIDPEYRNSGAATLLIKEIIKYVSHRTNRFDFEGSMIEGVENSFRQFGTIQKPYFWVTKVNSRLLKVKQGLVLLKEAALRK